MTENTNETTGEGNNEPDQEQEVYPNQTKVYQLIEVAEGLGWNEAEQLSAVRYLEKVRARGNISESQLERINKVLKNKDARNKIEQEQEHDTPPETETEGFTSSPETKPSEGDPKVSTENISIEELAKTRGWDADGEGSPSDFLYELRAGYQQNLARHLEAGFIDTNYIKKMKTWVSEITAIMPEQTVQDTAA